MVIIVYCAKPKESVQNIRVLINLELCQIRNLFILTETLQRWKNGRSKKTFENMLQVS